MTTAHESATSCWNERWTRPACISTPTTAALTQAVIQRLALICSFEHFVYKFISLLILRQIVKYVDIKDIRVFKYKGRFYLKRISNILISNFHIFCLNAAMWFLINYQVYSNWLDILNIIIYHLYY